MNQIEFIKLRDAIKANAAEKKAKIEADTEKQLSALDSIWNFLQENAPTQSDLAVVPDFSNNNAGSAVLIDAVREVLPTVQGFIHINNIIHSIERFGLDVKKPINPTSISGILRKLCADGELDVVEIGKGKRPSRYLLKNTDSKMVVNGERHSQNGNGQYPPQSD